MKIEDLYEIFLSCNGVCTDSRTVTKGSLFVAIAGEFFDGNKFAEQALSDGASYAIIDNFDFHNIPNTILVKDSLETLQELAKYHRNQLKIPVIGLTGSNGKTTTKELINAVLAKKYTCLATAGNFNNHIGVPLTLLKINNKHEMAIIEMGANHVQEIEMLCAICQPDYGLITNIGKAHIGEFGSYQNIIKAKTELYDFIKSTDGKLFVNSDDQLLMEKSSSINRMLYGSTSEANYQGHFISVNPFVSLRFDNEIINSKIIGKYNFDNFMVAAALGTYFDVNIEDIKEALESYVPSNNRSQIIKTEKNTLIMDAYNANPSSMEVAIENLVNMESAQKYFILGDMLELGLDSPSEHLNILQLAEKSVAKGIFVGAEFEKIYENNDQYRSFSSTKEALDYLTELDLSNQLILIKGSRGMKLEQLSVVL